MNNLLIGYFALISLASYAAEVVEAKLDESQENIEVTVRYGGGCKEHDFSLELTGCLEISPVQCEAKLVEKVIGGPDFCEAYITKVVVFNLSKMGLGDEYYRSATLTITGDGDRNGLESSASVVLP